MCTPFVYRDVPLRDDIAVSGACQGCFYKFIFNPRAGGADCKILRPRFFLQGLIPAWRGLPKVEPMARG